MLLLFFLFLNFLSLLKNKKDTVKLKMFFSSSVSSLILFLY